METENSAAQPQATTRRFILLTPDLRNKLVSEAETAIARIALQAALLRDLPADDLTIVPKPPNQPASP